MIRLMLLAYLLALLAVSVRHSFAQEPGDKPAAKALKGTRVVMLGTGTPNAEPTRSGSALAIIVNDTPYLVDCGPGVVRRATAAIVYAGVDALDVVNLNRLFVTHLHTDHTLGFPDLIFTPWVLGREEPLVVYGPPGIRAMSEHLLKAYEQDVNLRLRGHEGANAEGYKVEAHEIEPGLIYSDDNVKVRAFAVAHGSWEHAFGYRFETSDRTIVVSGDTRPSENLVRHAKGCDILIHEVYAAAGFAERSPKWQRYHSKFHTSSVELAAIANKVKPGLLVLYHQLYWGTTDEELLAEIKELYKGKVVSARDLDVF